MKCPHCENELKHDYTHCPYCDGPVEMKRPSTGMEVEEAPNTPMPRQQKIFLIASIIGFVLISLLMVVTTFMN